MMNRVTSLACVLLLTVVFGLGGSAQPAPPVAPAFTVSGELMLPTDYREWVFLGTGLGMTYGPARRATGEPLVFENTYVTRDAYLQFMRSGTWPEKTMF